MHKHLRTVILLLPIAASCAFAQSGFDGTWKMNTEKSKLTGDTLTIEDSGGGSMKYITSAESYTFKTDGSEVKTPMGSTVTWKQDDQNTYRTTSASDGYVGSATWKVSPDGKSLTVDGHGKRPNGEDFSSSGTYARVSGTKGLAGTWKSTKYQFDPPTMSMKMEGDSLHLDVPQDKATWDGKTDGKDIAWTGPQVTDHTTLAITKTGPNSLKMVTKLSGKPIDLSVYHVSADGKTLTVHGTNGQGKEPYTMVWEKQ